MTRSKIVRLELLLLAALVLLVVYRALEGPAAPDGLVVYADVKPEELLHRSVATDRPARIAIDAVGSFESEEVDRAGPLAAYGWILRSADRQVVWKMDPGAVTREGETLAVVRDTIELSPGTYEIYYTSYGNGPGHRFGISLLDRLLGVDRAWRGDADRWQMIVRSSGGDVPARVDSPSAEAVSPGGTGLLWSTAPMDGRENDEHVFQTTESVHLRIYAVGEIDQRRMDYGWLDDAVTGERVWEMTRDNTEAAGGLDVNRQFDGTLDLSPGIYRAGFETDAGHHFGEWRGNPPFDPAAWGITLFAENEDAVAGFDPWSTRTPIAQIDRVGDNERHTVQFQVREPVEIAAYGLGELGNNGRYDYAWILDNEAQAIIWEMTAERSRPAGGRNNRQELAFLTLEPGTYTLTYETDDSHSYTSWRHGQPDHPERWGATLFPVDAGVDSTVVEILDTGTERFDEAADAVDPPLGDQGHPPLPAGETMVDLTGLENEQRVATSFTLEEPQLLQIRAVGEISLSAPYDYGWIEHAENGEIVWQMTWQNTVPAGGGDRNRMFDGTLSLVPGDYVAHFKTDFSHAYGDFGDEAPRNPEAWGIHVVNPEHPPR